MSHHSHNAEHRQPSLEAGSRTPVKVRPDVRRELLQDTSYLSPGRSECHRHNLETALANKPQRAPKFIELEN